MDTVITAAASMLIVAVVAALTVVAPRAGPVRAAVASPRPSFAARFTSQLRRRRWARRAVSLATLAMLLGAVAMLAYPFATNVYQGRVQDRLTKELATPAVEEAYRERRVADGDPLTRIKIPAIAVDVVIVEGTGASALRAGAGHFPATALPCEEGNVGIAGHRTTYGRPFHNLDRLAVGDAITLDTPIGSCTYRVEVPPFVVAPNDVSVVAPTPAGSLTLVTCEPKGSAAKRLIVRARLIDSQPPGGALG